MQLSDCLIITASGILAYLGDGGKLHEVVGGTGGQLNLRELK